MNIKDNYRRISEQTCNNNVEIIAVSKYASISEIREAYECGICNFAENYAQDAIKKIKELSDLSIKWHFIGRLQKNKVKDVIDVFYLIHSVDSYDLAEYINKKCFEKNITQNILLQVNILDDATKAGFNKEEITTNFSKLIKLENIRIKGLMTVAPKTEDITTIKESFLGLKELRAKLNNTFNSNMTELSMGMSNDYLIAVDCGSTMLRIGKGLFKGSNGG